MSIFLVTVLNCSQVNAVAQKLQGIALLTPKQKIEIVQELRKVVPSCPIIIKEK